MRRPRASVLAMAVVAVLQSSSLDGCDCTEWTYADPGAAVLGGIVCGKRYRPPNEPPSVSFTISPNPVRSGEEVTFDASATTDPDSERLTYEWDLDGSNLPGLRYEVTTSEPTITRQVTTRFGLGGERRQIALRVSDGRDATVSRQILEIEVHSPPPPPSAPVAWFVATPNPGYVGESVHFDASPSSDPNGDPLRYQWDFEGDGEYTAAQTEATATRVYSTAGVREVRLRVIDSTGLATVTSRTVTIRPVGASATAARASVRFTAALRGRTPAARLGELTRRGRRVILRGHGLRGRLRARVREGRRSSLLDGFLASRWTARLTLRANVRTRRAAIRGIALARFAGSRDRGCLRLRLRSRGARTATGRFTLTGGTGAAARLRAAGTLRFNATTGALTGSVSARPGARRALPRECRRLR